MNREESIHLVFRGQVQGVWFRRTAEEIAKRLGVVGYVRNLPDGSVEAVVRGTPDVLQSFETELGARYRDQIVDCTRVIWEGAEDFRRFEIRR